MKEISYTLAAVFFSLMAVCGAVFTGAVDASWAGMTMRELVDGSDAIVSGEVVDVRAADAPDAQGAGRDIATVRITEVLSGGITDAEVMVLFPSERARVRASVDIAYKVGHKGVWFLRKKTGSGKAKDSSLFLADHPQRLMGFEHLETIRGFIKARGQER